MHEEVEAKRLENKGKKEVNDLVSSVETHTDADGNVQIVWHANTSTVQGWQFKNEFRRWKTEQNELDTRDAKTLLERKVAEGQLDNNEVVQSLVKMPALECSKFFNEIANLKEVRKLTIKQADLTDKQASLTVTQDEMLKLEKEIKEHTNPYEVIKKLGSADTPWYEKIAMVMAAFFSMRM